MKKQNNRDLLNSIRPQYITQEELDLIIYTKKLEALNITVEDDLPDNEHLPDDPEFNENEKN